MSESLDRERWVTEFSRPDGPSISVGPVPGRKQVALAVGRDGWPSHTVVAYFRSEEGAEEFKDALRGLFGSRLTQVDGEDA